MRLDGMRLLGNGAPDKGSIKGVEMLEGSWLVQPRHHSPTPGTLCVHSAARVRSRVGSNWREAMWARESFWSHSQLSRRCSQTDRALGWNTAILRSSEERKLNIRKCLFPPNGAFRRRSRTELRRSVDTNLNVKHRRQQRRFRRCVIDTRRWCRLGSAMLSLDLPPDFVGRFSDPSFGNEFARHRGEHVIILLERLQSFSTELALHGERNQQLLAHEPQARRLHPVVVMYTQAASRLPLPHPPRPPAGLP